MKLKIVLVGAGSHEFGPGTIRDILLSEILCKYDLEIVLMDISDHHLQDHKRYAVEVAQKLNRTPRVSISTELDESLQGADFVICSIEIKRYHFWSQDFHIPRKYGFNQVYGENGGPGGLFHALRNFKPMLEIAFAMERICPDAWLLNFTNPLTKLCELISRQSIIKSIGLCHGIFQGKKQLCKLLELDIDDLDAKACGINHFTWFQEIRHKKTGEDLYPSLKEKEKRAHWLAEWDEIALSRTLFRAFGLYPSPGANHIGEYIRWADGMLGSSILQYYYDPMTGDPWSNDKIPTFVYNLDTNPTNTEFYPEEDIKTIYPKSKPKRKGEILPSGELAIPIIEGLFGGAHHHLAAVNIPNKGHFIPGLPEDAVVEVPAQIYKLGFHPEKMKPLPEGPLALMRTQCSIHKLLVEAFVEGSKNKLLQAVLLDPTCHSYHAAIHMINEMCDLQKEVLPPLEWDSG